MQNDGLATNDTQDCTASKEPHVAVDFDSQYVSARVTVRGA